ncbi:hypothetical protein DID99_02650 [Burkholderia sp. Bp8986]|nr:hypothetical protein DID99_02650 [Burkholderia sp. Bp8986]
MSDASAAPACGFGADAVGCPLGGRFAAASRPALARRCAVGRTDRAGDLRAARGRASPAIPRATRNG